MLLSWYVLEIIEESSGSVNDCQSAFSTVTPPCDIFVRMESSPDILDGTTPRLRSLASDFLYYGGGTAFHKGLGFLLIPIFTTYLLPSEYGVLEILEVFVALLGTIGLLGQDQSVSRFHFQSEGERKEHQLGNCLAASSAASIFVSALLLFSTPVTAAFFLTEAASPRLFIALSAIRLPFQCLSAVLLMSIRMERLRLAYLALTTLAALLDVGISIELVVRREAGLAGFLVANAVSFAVLASSSAVLLRRSVKISFTDNAAFRFGAMLMPAALISVILRLTDRLLVGAWAGMDALGLYAIAGRFAGFIWMIEAALALAWLPLMYRWAGVGDFYRLRTAGILSVYALFGSATIVSILSCELIPLMTPGEFHGAVALVPGLALAAAANGAAVVTRSGLLLAKNTTRVFLAECAALATLLALSAPLISWMGATGASIATCSAFLCSAAVAAAGTRGAMPEAGIDMSETAAVALLSIVASAAAVMSQASLTRAAVIVIYAGIVFVRLRRYLK